MRETRSSPFLVGAPKRARLVAKYKPSKRSPVIGKAEAPSKPVVVADPTPAASRGAPGADGEGHRRPRTRVLPEPEGQPARQYVRVSAQLRGPEAGGQGAGGDLRPHRA